MVLAISFGERDPGSIPGETHVEEIIDFSKWAVYAARTRDCAISTTRPTNCAKRFLWLKVKKFMVES